MKVLKTMIGALLIFMLVSVAWAMPKNDGGHDVGLVFLLVDIRDSVSNAEVYIGDVLVLGGNTDQDGDTIFTLSINMADSTILELRVNGKVVANHSFGISGDTVLTCTGEQLACDKFTAG